MKKVIKLTESDLRRIIEKVISEQSRRGTNPQVLQAIANMNFKIEACKKEENENSELSHEFCNTTYPNIMISYVDNGLELLDLKNFKKIKVWEVFNEKDIPELENYVKMATS